MAPDDASRGNAPDFALSPVQRESLLAFAAAGFDSLKQDSPVEFAHRQMTNLRCTACHAQDGSTSTWAALEGEMIPLQSGAPVPEGEGVAHASTAIPMLTWLGEKLQPDWSAKFIAGGIDSKATAVDHRTHARLRRSSRCWLRGWRMITATRRRRWQSANRSGVRQGWRDVDWREWWL